MKRFLCGRSSFFYLARALFLFEHTLFKATMSNIPGAGPAPGESETHDFDSSPVFHDHGFQHSAGIGNGPATYAAEGSADGGPHPNYGGTPPKPQHTESTDSKVYKQDALQQKAEEDDAAQRAEHRHEQAVNYNHQLDNQSQGYMGARPFNTEPTAADSTSMERDRAMNTPEEIEKRKSMAPENARQQK